MGTIGETIDIALDPRYQFDRVLSFEPSQVCLRVRHRFKDPRAEVFRIALTNKNGPQEFFGAGLLGASTRQKHYEGYSRRDVVPSLDVGAFLSACCGESDDIYLKMNCEGSEVEIIESLVEAGFLDRLHSLYVEFDIVGMVADGDSLRVRSEEFLKDSSVSYITSADLGCGAREGVKTWLESSVPVSRAGCLRRLYYRVGAHRPLYVTLRQAGIAILPEPILKATSRLLGKVRRPI